MSCKNTPSRYSDSEVKLIEIDWNNVNNAMDYSSLVEDSVQIFALETTTEHLIGEITKLVCENNLIYIADNLSKSIFIFDMSGKLKSRIHAVGNGPGEYINISYFTVHGTDLVVLDHYQRKLLFYNEDGQFICDKNIETFWGTDMFCIGDLLYFPNNGSHSKSGFYHLFTMNLANSDELGKYLPFEERKNKQGWSIDSYYAPLRNEALVCFWPFDELYTVKDNDVFLSYQINFGDRRLPQQYIEGDGTTALRTAVRDNYVTGIRRVWQTEKYIFLYFSDAKDGYITLYNKKTGEVQTTRNLRNAKMGNLPLQTNGEGFIIHNEQIIQCYNADYWNFPGTPEFLESEDAHFYTKELRLKFLELAKTDGSELNPIIFIQKLRK